MFTHIDYTDAGPRARIVHGSFMTGAFAVIRTVLGRVVRIEYNAARAVQIRVATDSDAGMKTLRAPVTRTFDDIILTFANRVVTITTPVLKVVASSRFKKGILRGKSCATGKCFLNVAVSPLNYSAFDKLAPHGLIGQVYHPHSTDLSFLLASLSFGSLHLPLLGSCLAQPFMHSQLNQALTQTRRIPEQTNLDQTTPYHNQQH